MLNYILYLIQKSKKHAIVLANYLCLFILVDGQWLPWSVWSDCSVSCGPGQRNRFRFCSNPKPVNGGLNCTGQSEDHQACDYIACPGKIFLNLNENTSLNPTYALA